MTLPESPTPSESWEDRARQGFDAFAEMIVAHPAAARLGLVEAYAAGPEALSHSNRRSRGSNG